jgi:hypothetical protein
VFRVFFFLCSFFTCALAGLGRELRPEPHVRGSTSRACKATQLRLNYTRLWELYLVEPHPGHTQPLQWLTGVQVLYCSDVADRAGCIPCCILPRISRGRRISNAWRRRRGAAEDRTRRRTWSPGRIASGATPTAWAPPDRPGAHHRASSKTSSTSRPPPGVAQGPNQVDGSLVLGVFRCFTVFFTCAPWDPGLSSG